MPAEQSQVDCTFRKDTDALLYSELHFYCWLSLKLQRDKIKQYQRKVNVPN